MLTSYNTSNYIFITILLVIILTGFDFNLSHEESPPVFNGDKLVKAPGANSESVSQLVSFNATIQDKQVLLSWETSSELNNRFFVIEKSINGSSFSELSKIKSVSNSEVGNEYSIVDNNVPSYTAYYRLSRIDLTGKSTFSDIVSVTNEKSLSNSCNINIDKKPCIGKCNVSFKNCSTANLKNFNIEMFDFLGNSIHSRVTNQKASSSMEFDTQNYLKPGIFITKSALVNKSEDKK